MTDKHFLLFYDAGPDLAERRAPYRAAHLAHVKAAVARGEIVLAGAYADPIDGSVFLFRTPDRAVVEAFSAADPYVTEGVVRTWRVREWTTVAGEGAVAPL